ncbi:hypothetical protein GGS20DRAFT_584889 [Poronia punctata]|nr:hypothetical protein GGS20DRAFT_584889 [Poronia punctata]
MARPNSMGSEPSDYSLPKTAKKGKRTSHAVNDNDIEKHHVEHISRIDTQTPPPYKKKKQTRWQKLKRHWARFWCCYMLAGVIFLAILLPLLFLKIIPALAQYLVNKTNLPIYGGSIQALTSDSLRVSLSTSLTVPGGLKVRLGPLTLFLYNKETPEYSPFLTVPIEGQWVAGKTDIDVVDETVFVANETELNIWLGQALTQEKTKLSVKGNTTAYLGILKNHINLDKTVEIPGLRELQGASIEEATVLTPAAEDGSNLVGTLMLPNWSDLSMGLGNNTLNIWAGEVLVANADLRDINLVPGNNSLPFRGVIYVDALVKNFASILGSQSDTLFEGKLDLWANGNQSVINGEHITYLESVLSKARISTQVPIVQLASQLAGGILKGNTTIGGLWDLLTDGLSGGDGSSGSGTNPFADLLDNFNITRSEIDEFSHTMRLLRDRKDEYWKKKR